MFLSIIDRYVIRQVLVPFLLGLLVFTFIFIIPVMVDRAEGLVAKGVPAAIVFSLMVRLIPQALAITLPMSLLLALLIAFGRLSADREFVAMQACGVSLLRLLRPVGIISVGAWAATLYVMVVAVPNANKAFQEIVFGISAQRAEGEVKPRIFYDDFPNIVLYAREVPPAGGGWNGVFAVDQRPGRPASAYLAERGRVVINTAEKRIDMVLDNGTSYTTQPDGNYDVNAFESATFNVDAAGIFGGAATRGVNEMTIAELRAQMAQNEQLIDPTSGRPFSTHNERMAIHQKFSIPVACLVFGLIGLALGATHRRDGMLGSFVLGIVIVFAYYVPLNLGPSMVKANMIPVWLGKWLPNIVLGALGVAMFIWRDRVADQPIRLPIPAWVQRRTYRVSSHRLRGLTILDWYVASAYLRHVALSAVALIGIFYIAALVEMSDKVFKGSATLPMLLEYYRYATPQWIYFALPVAVLLGTLITIAILTKNSELIVMKACGISLYRVALPMFVTAALAGGALFALEETVLGPSNRRAEEIRHVIRGGDPATFDVLHNRWMVGSRGEIYHYQWFNPTNHQVSGLSIYEFADTMSRLARHSYVHLGTWQQTDEEEPLDRWHVESGWTRTIDDKRKVVATPFASETRRIEAANYFGTEEPDARFMGYSALRDNTTSLAASGFDVVPQQVAVARKLAFPFVTIVMTLLAVPFAVTIGRSGAMGGIGVGIALAITYGTVISVFAAIGAGGGLSPQVAAWAPNLLFGSAAAYMLLTVRT